MRAHRLAPLFTGTLCGVSLLCALTGCTPDEEKITRMLQEHLDRCKKAEGDIAQIKVSGGVDPQPMLVEACAEPVTDVVVDSGIEATAKTGPYTWTIEQNTESGVWVATDVKWEDFHGAMRQLADSDANESVLADGAERLAAAQQTYPRSTLVRIKRMEILLKLRRVLRSKSGQDDPNGIGEQAQAYYDELIAWSNENDQKDVGALANVMVIDYLKGLGSFVDDSIDTLGYGDDNLETSISVAQKDKDKESEEAYRKELEESRAKRPAQRAALEARKVAIKATLCKQLGELDAQAIKDGELKERAIATKSSVNCAEPAAQP